MERPVVYPACAKATRETVFGLTSLPAALAPPARLLALIRDPWAIENRLHCGRDVVFHEDAGLSRFAHLPQVLAIFNNLVLSMLRVRGFDSPAAARCQFDACLSLALNFILCALS